MESISTQFGCRDMNLDLQMCLSIPLGLDRHIQAISTDLQWICQSTASNDGATTMKSFHHLVQKPTKKVIGLMSGTSVDGVDAALVEIMGHGLETQVELLAFHSHPFEAEVRDRIFDLFQPETSCVDEICQMNFLIGEVFAEAAVAVIHEAREEVREIDLIGSHGQTIYHLPPQAAAEYVPSTLQIGEPAVIAYRTGIPTVGNFRVADLAAGGQGAPLVPYVDFLLFRKADRTIALQNIGGISNVTLIPAPVTGSSRTDAVGSDVLASDTGPGNMIIDSVMEILTEGEEKYDDGGRFAAQGRVCKSLLGEWLQHPFISAPPPKTTGREAFGRQFAHQALQQAQNRNLGQADLVATLTAYTAETIFDYYSRFLLPHYSVDEIYISGGGVHNVTLMEHLERLFQPIPILPIDSIGISSDAKEAISFAVLANEAVHGNPTNLPQVTGASQPMVLGTFSPA